MNQPRYWTPLMVIAAACAVLMLCPSAYFNVAPNIERAATDHSMRGMVAVQISCVILIAIIPFVRHRMSHSGAIWLTCSLLVFNAFVAFQTANHRHDADTGAAKSARFQANAIERELSEWRTKLATIGEFETATRDEAAAKEAQLVAARKDKEACRRWCEDRAQAVQTKEGEYNAILARVRKTADKKEAQEKIAEGENKRREIGYVPEHADQTSARLASLFPYATPEGVAKWWMLFQALMIEILNRFGPEMMFSFVIGLRHPDGRIEREPPQAPDNARTISVIPAAAEQITTALAAASPTSTPRTKAPRKAKATRITTAADVEDTRPIGSVEQWFRARTRAAHDGEPCAPIDATTLRADYIEWCGAKFQPANPTAFGRILKTQLGVGFETDSRKVTWYKGIALKPLLSVVAGR